MSHLVETLANAYDSDKEDLLEISAQLYAKRQILINEAAKRRFADADLAKTASPQTKREMQNYAKAIYMIRGEIRELINERKDL